MKFFRILLKRFVFAISLFVPTILWGQSSEFSTLYEYSEKAELLGANFPAWMLSSSSKALWQGSFLYSNPYQIYGLHQSETKLLRQGKNWGGVWKSSFTQLDSIYSELESSLGVNFLAKKQFIVGGSAKIRYTDIQGKRQVEYLSLNAGSTYLIENKIAFGVFVKQFIVPYNPESTYHGIRPDLELLWAHHSGASVLNVHRTQTSHWRWLVARTWNIYSQFDLFASISGTPFRAAIGFSMRFGSCVLGSVQKIHSVLGRTPSYFSAWTWESDS